MAERVNDTSNEPLTPGQERFIRFVRAHARREIEHEAANEFYRATGLWALTEGQGPMDANLYFFLTLDQLKASGKGTESIDLIQAMQIADPDRIEDPMTASPGYEFKEHLAHYRSNQPDYVRHGGEFLQEDEAGQRLTLPGANLDPQAIEVVEGLISLEASGRLVEVNRHFDLV